MALQDAAGLEVRVGLLAAAQRLGAGQRASATGPVGGCVAARAAGHPTGIGECAGAFIGQAQGCQGGQQAQPDQRVGGVPG